MSQLPEHPDTPDLVRPAGDPDALRCGDETVPTNSATITTCGLRIAAEPDPEPAA